MRTRNASSVPFNMAIENVELMQECSLEHLRMETTRLKKDKETNEESSRKD